MWAVTKWRTRSGFPELHPFPATTSHANIPRIPVFYIGVSCADYLHVVSVLRHHIESESKTRKKSSFGKYSTRRGMGPPLNCERMKVTHPGPADSTLIWVQERKPRACTHQSQHPRVCLRHFWSLSHSWNLLFFFFFKFRIYHTAVAAGNNIFYHSKASELHVWVHKADIYRSKSENIRNDREEKKRSPPNHTLFAVCVSVTLLRGLLGGAHMWSTRLQDDCIHIKTSPGNQNTDVAEYTRRAERQVSDSPFLEWLSFTSWQRSGQLPVTSQWWRCNVHNQIMGPDHHFVSFPSNLIQFFIARSRIFMQKSQ